MIIKFTALPVLKIDRREPCLMFLDKDLTPLISDLNTVFNFPFPRTLLSTMAYILTTFLGNMSRFLYFQKLFNVITRRLFFCTQETLTKHETVWNISFRFTCRREIAYSSMRML